MKPSSDEYSRFVEHPRFGKGPRVTGLDPVNSADGSVYCHWHSGPGIRVPNTAVVADVAKQRPATVHVTHYFDARRTCRTCRRPFLFFGEEQKFWYEELGLPLEADCLDCVLCRRHEQQLRAAHENYNALLAVTGRTEMETLVLVACAVLLVEADVFSAKVLPKLRGLLKPTLAVPEGPSYSEAAALLSRINDAAAR
jgi:hypothetical protein